MYELGLIYLFLYPILLFVSLGQYKTQNNILLLCSAVILASVMFSSRIHFATESDDMIRYYEAYLWAKNRSLFQYIEYVNREAVYVASNWLLYQFLGDISSRFYLFLTSFIFNICITFALYKIFENQRYRLFLIFSILFLPSIGMHTQLVRQTLAFAVFLLFLSADKYSIKFIFGILAIGIHKIILIFFVVLWLYKYTNRIIMSKWIITFLPVICFLIGNVFDINLIVNSLQLIPVIGNKALFLKGIDVAPLKFGIVTLASIFLFSLLGLKLNKVLLFMTEKEKKLFFITFVFICLSLIFAFFKPLAERFTFMYLILLPWFYILNMQAYGKVKDYRAYLIVFFGILTFLFVLNLTLNHSKFSLFDAELKNQSK